MRRNYVHIFNKTEKVFGHTLLKFLLKMTMIKILANTNDSSDSTAPSYYSNNNPY